MTERPRNRGMELEDPWRDWSHSEPSLDEEQLKRALASRISSSRSGVRAPLVVAAVAASVVLVLVGIDQGGRPQSQPPTVSAPPVHDPAGDVILILREGKAPIYVLTDPDPRSQGGSR
jgi:hypothetical protein